MRALAREYGADVLVIAAMDVAALCWLVSIWLDF